MSSTPDEPDEPAQPPSHEPGDTPPAAPVDAEQNPPSTLAPPNDASLYRPSHPDQPQGPGMVAGVSTGCGLQLLGVFLMFASLGVATNFFGYLWPFVLTTICSALLLLSDHWRRFATGVLIVSLAAWIVVIGPCIALLQGI